MFEVLSDDPSWICIALQAPLHFFGASGNPEIMKLIWDSGASILITPNKDDYVDDLKPLPNPICLNGLAKGLKIAGIGKVHWNVLDTSSKLQILKIPAYHVPESPMRLLSTTRLFQTYADKTIVIHPHQLVLSRVEGDPDRTPVTVWVDPSNNLLVSQMFHPQEAKVAVKALVTTTSEVSDSNITLSSELQKE